MAAADGTLDTTGAPVNLQLPLPGGGATPGPNGPLQSYTVTPDGTIVGVFNSGLKQNIRQIALATEPVSVSIAAPPPITSVVAMDRPRKRSKDGPS